MLWGCFAAGGTGAMHKPLAKTLILRHVPVAPEERTKNSDQFCQEMWLNI